MAELERILDIVEDLKKGLEATIFETTTGEPCHICIESDRSPKSSCNGSCDCHYTSAEISVPDERTRDKSREDLDQIYLNNEWFAARYGAAQALRIEDLDNVLSGWVEQLKRLTSPTVTTEANPRLDLIRDVGLLYSQCEDKRLRDILYLTHKTDPDKKISETAKDMLDY